MIFQLKIFSFHLLFNLRTLQQLNNIMLQVLKLKNFKDCLNCIRRLLIDQDSAKDARDLPYLFTFYLSKGGLKFVSKSVYDLGFLAMSFFKDMDSAKQLIETQRASSVATVAETLSNMFCATDVCKLFVEEQIPECHTELVAFFVKYLYSSVCRRKLNLLNAALPKEVVHAGKTALMQTNSLVQKNNGNVLI